jgi:hypothetical protein
MTWNRARDLATCSPRTHKKWSTSRRDQTRLIEFISPCLLRTSSHFILPFPSLSSSPSKPTTTTSQETRLNQTPTRSKMPARGTSPANSSRSNPKTLHSPSDRPPHQHLSLSLSLSLSRTSPPPQFSDSGFPQGMSLHDRPAVPWSCNPQYAAASILYQEPSSLPRMASLRVHQPPIFLSLSL